MDVNVIFGDQHYSPFLSRYVKLKLEDLADHFPHDTRLAIEIEDSPQAKRVIKCNLHSEERELEFQEVSVLNAKHAVDKVINRLRDACQKWQKLVSRQTLLEAR